MELKVATRGKGRCPVCDTELLFAELVLDMWCPKCRKYLSAIKSQNGNKSDNEQLRYPDGSAKS